MDSETLHFPELRPLIGRTVEEQLPTVRYEFYVEAGRLPQTEEAFEAQKAIFRTWRGDRRFQPYWLVLDDLLRRTFDQVRKWAIEAQLPLDDYDCDAIRDQDRVRP